MSKTELLTPRLMAGGTAYRRAGSGEALVFIHGVGLNADAWQPQFEEFSKTHDVIAIDMLGHGKSALPNLAAKLDDYVQQIADLLHKLGIEKANHVGHSMGGLVAIGFALAYPKRALRLAVLNSVYERTPEKRAAVQMRAGEISQSGTIGNIEVPVSRWFGPLEQQPPIAKTVRAWLQMVDPRGYAAAYSLFATSDETFAGRLGELQMPSLFATGADDENSTPEMAKAMARQVPHGKSLIIDSERHMMNLTNPTAVNAALRQWLQEPLNVPTNVIDPKDLRKAFGTFMTGVTVVTTREANGSLRGFTANSFSSVSLDPPLLLVCISKFAASYETFNQTKSFAVNILSENQQTVSGVFASKRPDKFSDVNHTASASGNPLIEGAVAWFDCINHNVVDAGDHVILIGRVTSYAHTEASPLGYARGGYFTLGLEQSAVNAAAASSRTEVGAILECEGKLLVIPDADGVYNLPHVGRHGEAGSATKLLSSLTAKGIRASLSFLFAVYENSADQSQCIIYRGTSENAGGAMLIDFENLPFEKFRDDATRSMLRRYCGERLEGRYKIYSGDHVSGDVRDVGEAQ